jgi:hypothetical protein
MNVALNLDRLPSGHYYFLFLAGLAAAAGAAAFHAAVAGSVADHDGAAGAAAGGVAHVVHALHGVGCVVEAAVFDRVVLSSQLSVLRETCAGREVVGDGRLRLACDALLRGGAVGVFEGFAEDRVGLGDFVAC